MDSRAARAALLATPIASGKSVVTFSGSPSIARMTSPTRSLVQSGTGQITVTGVVTPNENGDLVEKVLVNGVQAIVQPDGSFNATISIKPGATLINTTARDSAGQVAEDTRAVLVGRAADADVLHATTAVLAGPEIEQMQTDVLAGVVTPEY